MPMSTLFLARLQFALTISFHYIFPPLSIGLSVLLVIMEGLYFKTNKPIYHQMARFWTKVFGLVFAIGVATGIVMEFEFGTNWASYSRYVGDVFGSPLASEGIFAFFLESGFLGYPSFGWDRVPRWLHLLSTVLVSLGAHLSAVWIVVANSWMQTPAGYHIVGGVLHPRAEITDFWAMVFNPSTGVRVFHVFSGAWQAGAWLAVSISAWYLLHKRHVEFAKATFKIGLVVSLVSSLLQLGSGHLSAIVVARTQPEKLAAMEGLYAASAPGDLHLFGWVNEREKRVEAGLAVPGLLSLMVHGNTTAPVPGLDAFAPADRPPVNFTFQTYHAMVAIGMGLDRVELCGGFFSGGAARCGKRGSTLWLCVFAVMGPQEPISLVGIPPRLAASPGLSTICCALRKGSPKSSAPSSSWARFSCSPLFIFCCSRFSFSSSIRR